MHQLLIIEDLKVYYPVYGSIASRILGKPTAYVKAVDGVSLAIGRGEWVSVVGESGSGKTTLAKAIVGLLKPTAGTILFDGIDVARLSRRDWRRRGLRRRIQLVQQDPLESLDPMMPVGEQIREALEANGVARRGEARRKALEALEDVGLTPPEEMYKRRPRQLSGGQRQRVAIARALALEPDLIVADEPVSMIDVSLRASILDLLDKARRRGTSVLMITHDIATAWIYSDRIAVMYLGKIVEEGSSNSVARDPRHPYTAALVTSVPSLASRKPPKWPVEGEVPSGLRIPGGCRFHPRCPLATSECKEREPPETVENGGRRYRCIHPLPPGGVWKPPRRG